MKISNLMTLFRIALVPLFPIAFFSPHPNGPLIALGIFIVAGVTDFLDGFIARRYQMVSEFGIVMDPLADKLMFIAVFLTLWMDQRIPLWILIVLVTRELFMIASGVYLYWRKRKMVIPSNVFGKSATALLFIAIPLQLIFPENHISPIIIRVALGFMIVALILYARYYFQDRKS